MIDLKVRQAMKKKLGILLLIVIILGLVIGIVYKNNTNKEEKESGKFKIVTTFYPVYIMTSNIAEGAQNIELVNMTDVNVGCLHDYTLSTADMKKIEKADVIIQNGLGLEDFMDKILSTYSDIKVIDTSKKISNKIEENGNLNAHIWTSISNYLLQVEQITDELCGLNPENTSIYQENANKYKEKLKEVQTKYSSELDNLKRKEGYLFK